MRTVAIILGDNDYGNTFIPLLKTIYRAIQWNGELDEQTVTTSIMSAIEFHYITFQCGSGADTVHIHNTLIYLRMVGLTILFDDAAEADIEKVDHDHGAWYLDCTTGNVFAY